MLSFRDRHQPRDIPERVKFLQFTFAKSFVQSFCQMATVLTLFIPQRFIFYETEFQAGLLIIEQGMSLRKSPKLTIHQPSGSRKRRLSWPTMCTTS